jgi:hypothetical protein
MALPPILLSKVCVDLFWLLPFSSIHSISKKKLSHKYSSFISFFPLLLVLAQLPQQQLFSLSICFPGTIPVQVNEQKWFY